VKCPNCGLLTNSKVIDSRSHNRTVKRTRVCSECNHKWITYEVNELEYDTPRNKHVYIGWSEGELVTLATLYEKGLKKAHIGRLLGRSRMSVSRQLDKLMASGEYFSLLETIKLKA
jgi:hypothetical protein